MKLWEEKLQQAQKKQYHWMKNRTRGTTNTEEEEGSKEFKIIKYYDKTTELLLKVYEEECSAYRINHTQHRATYQYKQFHHP